MLRTPLRWSGAALAVAASLGAVTAPLPDVLVSGDGQAAAIRGGDGRLAVLHSKRDAFAVKEWLAADGDSRTVKDTSLRDGVTCDAAGCIGRLSDGRLVSQALSVEAFAKDCARRGGGQRAGSARRLRREAHRPQGMARQWRRGAALDRRSFRTQCRAAARLPAALGAEPTQRKWKWVGAAPPGRARCNAAAGRIGRG